MFSPTAPSFDLGLGLGLGLTTSPYTLETGFNSNNNIGDNTNTPIYGGYHDNVHQHHHPLCHDEGGHHVIDDPLCLHGVGGAAPNVLREPRTIELEVTSGVINDTAATAVVDAVAGGTEEQVKKEQEGEGKFSV